MDEKPYREIPLTQGKVALVDAEDFDFLNQWKWCVAKVGKCGHLYAVRCSPKSENGKKKTTVRMHRVIMNAAPDILVDHKKHTTLDNRKQNLRTCTRKQNNSNSSSRKGSTSKYLGVSFDKNRKKWTVRVKIDGRVKSLGRFDEEREAAVVYNEAAKKHYGEFANLNIIE